MSSSLDLSDALDAPVLALRGDLGVDGVLPFSLVSGEDEIKSFFFFLVPEWDRECREGDDLESSSF